MIDSDIRLRYEAAKVAARIQGRDLLESLDRATLIWTPERQKQFAERRAQILETLTISHFLPQGVTVETATLNDLRKGIATWLRRSA
jgi:hypothetical protein